MLIYCDELTLLTLLLDRTETTSQPLNTALHSLYVTAVTAL